jgi:hypothetical protein
MSHTASHLELQTLQTSPTILQEREREQQNQQEQNQQEQE